MQDHQREPNSLALPMASGLSNTLAAMNTSFNKLVERNREVMERVMRTTQEESLRFINQRLECNARTMENLRDCKGLSGLIAVEQDWIFKTARDYAAGTERIGGLLFELAEHDIKAGAEEGTRAASSFQSAARADAEKARRAAEEAARAA